MTAETHDDHTPHFQLNKQRIATLHALYIAQQPLGAPEICRYTRVSRFTTVRHLQLFMERGWIELKRDTAGRIPRYQLTDSGIDRAEGLRDLHPHAVGGVAR